MKCLHLLARGIIFLLGWRSFTPDMIQQIKSHPRAVLIFSHTSYFDFAFLILLKWAYPDVLPHLKTLVKPQTFDYFGWFLRPLGCMPAPKLENRRGGSTRRIIAELSLYPQFLFAICPKGTMSRNEWRSGYYQIAHQLQVPIMVTGIDYERKRLCLSKPIDSSMPESDVKPVLQSIMGNIVPLHPKCEAMPIRPHNPFKISMIEWSRLQMVAIGLLVTYVTWIQ